MNKKEILIYFLGLALILIVSIGLFTKPDAPFVKNNEETKRSISVTGVGEVKAQPDMATITIGVRTENKDLVPAQQENKNRMNDVFEVLKQLNIDEKDIKTVNYNVYPEQQYDPKNNTSYLRAYVVTNNVEVTVRDLDILGLAIDQVTAKNANLIHNIRFGLSNQEELRNKALEMALINSQNKASHMMGVYKIKDISPIKIQENYQTSYNGPQIYKEMAMDSSNSTPISSGEMNITATVYVEYEF